MQLTEQTLNTIINYLVTQPYKDVAGIISMIQQDLQPTKEDTEPTE